MKSLVIYAQDGLAQYIDLKSIVVGSKQLTAAREEVSGCGCKQTVKNVVVTCRVHLYNAHFQLSRSVY